MDPDQVNLSLNQKKIAFAQSDHIEAVLAILKESSRQTKLVGDTEFETLVNAITMDAQGEMIIKFLNTIDFIKKGGLVTTDL